MQVANTLNNTIRILFNPRIEPFKLFDFLVVKSDDNRYVAQIIEIYDDKFDSSQNVAKIKLFYRINENDEVTPYDNFTPNKECEIVKIKHEEIENFVNQDNETFIFGTNIKNSSSLNLQYKFFDNNAVVLADKIENAVCMTYNLAKKLSSKKNVVIIDSTGSLELEGAKKIKASKNFKMPLNYATIDHVFNKCLADSSLEFQAIGGEIINEIKRFAKKQEGQFIPFNMLTKVLLEQYNATPYPELKVLLMRIKKFQMDDIFAKNKNDKENLSKAVEKNPITIIDLSTISPYWQKIYIDYIISEISQEIYLITRINDEHFDTTLINKIYNQKTNIKFIPTVSYNYKKLPTVMQHCKNYILMPSLQQRNDFLDANFALANLIPEGCIIFGKNTDNFLYLARDYELEIQESKKNYKKIELNTALTPNSMQHNLDEKSDYYEKKEQAEKLKAQEAKASSEIANFKAQKVESFDETPTFTKAPIQEVAPQKSKENFEVIENPIDTSNIAIEEDYFASIEENKVEVKNDASDDFQELEVKETKVEIKEENDFFNSLEEAEEEEINEEIKEDDEEEFEEISDSNEASEDEIEETEVEDEPKEDELEENNENEVEDESADDEGLTFEDLIGSKEKKTENDELKETSEKSILDEFLSSNEESQETETLAEVETPETADKEITEEFFEQPTEPASEEQSVEQKEETVELEELEVKTETEIQEEISEPPVEKAEQYEMGLIEFDVQEPKKEEQPQNNSEELSLDEELIITDTELNIETEDLNILSDEEAEQETQNSAEKTTQEEASKISADISQEDVELIAQDEVVQDTLQEESTGEVLVDEATETQDAPQEEISETNEEEVEEDFNLSDDELDFFEMADGDFGDEEENENSENSEDSEEETGISFDDEEDVDLGAIADSSIDDNFEEIINTKAKQSSQSVAIDENTKINIDIVNTQEKESNLPIFKEKRPKSEITFKEGDRVVHPRFGSGTVTRIIPVEGGTINYAVGVSFDDGTFKPLEPVSAKLELEQ